MALSNPFFIDVGDRSFGGWLSVRVERSLECATTQWGVAATRTWPGMEEGWWIEPGDRCKVRLYDRTVCEGWIDEIRVDYDGRRHQIEIGGRGLCSDLVDCSYIGPPWQWKSVDPGEVIRAIAAPFSIPVTIDGDMGEPIQFQIQQGECCWEAICRIAYLRQKLAYEMPDGSLMITAGSEEYLDVQLVQGENIFAASARLDDKDRFSHYIVKGQQKTKKGAKKKKEGSGGDDFYDRLPPPVTPRLAGDENDEDAAEIDEIPPEQCSFSTSGEVIDPGVRRYRPKLIVQSANTDNGTALDRANWEMQNRWGKSRRCEITLPGWLQPNGELWPINRRIVVEDEWMGLDRDLAITQVAHDVTNQGLRTILTCQPPEALIPELPKKEPKAKGGKKGKKGKKGAGTSGGEGPGFWEQRESERTAAGGRRTESRR